MSERHNKSFNPTDKNSLSHYAIERIGTITVISLMKLILFLCFFILLSSCSRTYVWTFSAYETGSPMAGVEIITDSTSSVQFTDSSGQFQTSIPNRFKNKLKFSASHPGYYDRDFFMEPSEIQLFPLITIDNDNKYGNPFYALDSINGVEICREPDTLATIVGGLDSLIQLLRNVGYISERKISKHQYSVKACFIIDEHGNVSNQKIDVSLPITAVFEPMSSISPEEMRFNNIKQIIPYFLERWDLKWIPATKDGKKRVFSDIIDISHSIDLREL